MLEAGDLEDAPDLLVLTAEDESAFAAIAGRGIDALPGAHDQGDPGRVDEGAVGEVDQDRGGRGGDSLLERPFELSGGGEVKLPVHLKEADAPLKL